MRKIEEEMCEAIRLRTNWKNGNTAVNQYSHGLPALEHHACVSLFGKNIATIDYNNNLSVHTNVQTLRKWPTQTTMSRLRALGVDVYTKQRQAYLSGIAIDSSSGPHFPPLVEVTP